MGTINFIDIEEKTKLETLKELEYFKVLDFISKKCLTAKGRELIQSSLPKDTIDWLINELELVNEFTNLLISDDEFPLENINDIRPFLNKSKIENSVLNTGELLSILDVIRVARQLKVFLQSRIEKYPILNTEITYIFDEPTLRKHIFDAINENGEIRDNATKELLRIRGEIIDKSNRLRSRMNKIVKHFTEENFTQEEFYTVRDGRFVLPIKSEHKRHLSGIIHGVSQTGATIFIEPTEIVEMNNEISYLKVEEQREIYEILKRLTKEVSRQSAILFDTYDIIGHLDALYAKANYALEFGGIKPVISDTNEIHLKKIYHPLLVQSRGKKNVVPLSIDFLDNKRGYLISGPNAGGKTVALKSIGLNILLALSGFFPLGEVHTNFRNIYSAIGDHQSIENDLSTFSSQLIKLKQILDIADSKSLILIDEIGSGTDPQEGGALASGILDTFVEIKLFFIATTHQSSLKTYALNREVIENASLEFNETALKPTYNFLAGSPGNSYAFFLAKNIGISSIVLDRAKSYLGDRQKELEKSIAVLQKYKQEARELIRQVNIDKSKLDEKQENLEKREKDLSNRKKEIISKAKMEAYSILQNANALVKNTIKELKLQQRDVNDVKREFNIKVKQLAEEISLMQKDEKRKEKKIISLEVGDIVGLIDGSQVGEVMEVNNKNHTALVDFNGIKFRLKFEQLYFKDKGNSNLKPPKKRTSEIVDYLKLDVDTKLDLRGMRVDEALKKLDKFLADSLLSNIGYVTIIHGKGTGALRSAIHKLLKDINEVKSFRIGELVEGGAGVTVVYF